MTTTQRGSASGLLDDHRLAAEDQLDVRRGVRLELLAGRLAHHHAGGGAHGRVDVVVPAALDRVALAGVVDVADCIRAADYLVAIGHADPARLIIRGRSAGGYTTLAALTGRPEVFKAGASYYGVADLERLARDTHKFESRYLDGLIAPYPDGEDVYRVRSRSTRRNDCPVR